MNAVDASDHYEIHSGEDTPSLLVVVIDTNPRAWALLRDVLPISKAIANILVFVNAHLALSSSHSVAVIAAHTHRAVWLYPSPPKPPVRDANDVEMTDADAGKDKKQPATSSANKLPQFAHIESTLLSSLHDLIQSTTKAELASTTTTLISGGLSLALAHINKTKELAMATGIDATKAEPAAPGVSASTAGAGVNGGGGSAARTVLHSRILTVSVSDSSADQYIPTMNAVFAASSAGVPLDVLALRGAAPFLQQGAFITGGTYIAATEPRGILAYLMTGFASTSGVGSQGLLLSPGSESVDFRAACFCHRRAVDTGYVCSVCLSIFCEVPSGAECLTCGSKLALGAYGHKPAVVPRVRKKKKRKVGVNGDSREGTGTPRPT
ncbi:hypothetical protein MCOR27_000680 [Pyricularia oryzae]|uniref:General transcription and DNA repair factor IIH subunit TFB4 n=5 Tax=Pyricularia TaxID=48558 RepID=A0ABQ8NCH4_PYRGI|nr:RNA polymerase II transcription factor B subunit 4 [Pyricularia oryzae 70-15]ELQ39698.1 RNA polymerase II transcription factor B subunit 4 [Pyricularia oryzae Y34]KAH8846134.1 hypothetical protein MCOR01_003340 [Pyricularia oryzae]KAI6294909.1 hypothetical protein MCOR33_008072 [Pyricularia grisea]EHA47635.1 RNA polymerase II transcription factor B subunit 4 [Pyricularia oryzae 70-15]KAH9432356.1 hypothetical protein MCOR02_007059 [Pyricularia oryzae]